MCRLTIYSTCTHAMHETGTCMYFRCCSHDITGISLCAHFVSGLICDIERIATWIIYLVLADACVQSIYLRLWMCGLLRWADQLCCMVYKKASKLLSCNASLQAFNIHDLLLKLTSNSTCMHWSMTTSAQNVPSLTFSLLCYCVGGWCRWLCFWGWVIGGLVEVGVPVLSSLTKLFQLHSAQVCRGTWFMRWRRMYSAWQIENKNFNGIYTLVRTRAMDLTSWSSIIM